MLNNNGVTLACNQTTTDQRASYVPSTAGMIARPAQWKWNPPASPGRSRPPLNWPNASPWRTTTKAPAPRPTPSRWARTSPERSPAANHERDHAGRRGLRRDGGDSVRLFYVTSRWRFHRQPGYPAKRLCHRLAVASYNDNGTDDSNQQHLLRQHRYRAVAASLPGLIVQHWR